jgi:hypothetical protein
MKNIILDHTQPRTVKQTKVINNGSTILTSNDHEKMLMVNQTYDCRMDAPFSVLLPFEHQVKEGDTIKFVNKFYSEISDIKRGWHLFNMTLLLPKFSCVNESGFGESILFDVDVFGIWLEAVYKDKDNVIWHIKEQRQNLMKLNYFGKLF